MDKEFAAADQRQTTSFVTVVSWIFIVLSGFMTFITLMQNIMLYTVFPLNEMNEAMNNNASDNLSFMQRVLLHGFNYFFLLIFLISAGTLVSSIYLLKRREWARKYFIGFLWFGIIMNIINILLQFIMGSKYDSGSNPIEEFSNVLVMIQIISFIFIAGLTVLFYWIIKKLRTDVIRSEFS